MLKLNGKHSFCCAAEERNGFFLISHKELKREITDKDVSYTFSFPIIDVDTPTIVCLCNMIYKNKSVSGIGEIRDYRILTDKEKENLIKTVSRKAFDDAALNLMGFKEAVYPYIHGYNTQKIKENTENINQEIPDVLVVGSLKGKKYSEIKDTENLKKYVKFLKEHPELEYDGIAQKQVDFLRGLEV